MQFWSKLVAHYVDWRARLSQIGGISMILCFGIAKVLDRIDLSSVLAYVGVWVGLSLALVGWILRRGRMVPPLVTDTDIIVSIEEIRIGEQRFRVNEIEYLDFLVNSYQGMPGPRVSPRGGIFGLLTGGRIVLNGCDNKLMFTADGKKHSFSFYLEDETAMRRLGMLFREFYTQRLRFRERNRAGRTFMFEQVMGRQAFEQAKQREGYS